MISRNIILEKLEETSSQLSNLLREDSELRDIDNLISDKTLRYDYYDCLSLDFKIIEYCLLNIKLLLLNDIEL